ncbi:MAG: riboflavin kinase, partial [Bacteroidales bacterium]|nr:riboflavin kinase [Bacteroidales bacterium]
MLPNRNISAPLEPSVATIGFFDGVHCGHRFLIRQVREEALRRGMRSMIVTFTRHPARVLRPEAELHLLTTTDEKMRLLRETGIDDVQMLPFTPQLAALSARDFMERVLRDRFNVRVLVIGYDHRFGHNRAEGFEDYVKVGCEIGMDVVQARELDGGQHVSSSAIRHALAEGRVEDAAAMLGRPYSLGGTVVRGHHVGTDLGFPTANLRLDDPDK